MSSKTSKKNLLQLIIAKRDGHEIEEKLWKEFVTNLQDYPDYQVSSFLMACLLQGLSKQETFFLTNEMMNSGKVLSFAGKNVIDKHSTGGVGDKTSFIIAPLAVACGLKVPMMAGRALGHTGGTIDKVESIPGFKTTYTFEEFSKSVKDFGLCLIGQTKDIAPADKNLYALRDVTGTVPSVELITASILSKKLAEGANGIMLDIKVGNGAFMKDLTSAKKLALSLSQVGQKFGRKVGYMISDMNQPLGQTVGNSLEILECLDVLNGQGPADLRQLSVELVSSMLLLAGKAKDRGQARKLVQEKLVNKDGLKVFEQWIQHQGGDLDQFRKFPPVAKSSSLFCSPVDGYLSQIETQKIGVLLQEMGGGRLRKDSPVDHQVGLTFHRKRGDKVSQGERIVTLHHHAHQKTKAWVECLEESLSFRKSKPKLPPLIYQQKLYR